MTRIFGSFVASISLVGAYGIFAIGIALMYQASRMLNLAHGAMAMVPAYVLYSLSAAGAPLVLALPLALGSGALLGYLVEKVFVGRLRSGGATAQTVGTVAALGVLVAVTARIYGTSSLSAVEVFPRGHIEVGFSVVSYGDIGLFAVLIAVSAGLFLLIERTDLGLMMRGTAESRLAASLMGVDPQRITSMTWALGGMLAALGGILLAAVTTLNPYGLTLQVLPAFIAALIGGMGSLYGALVGAAIVGLGQGLVPTLGPIGEWQGAPQLALAITAIAVMALRGQRLAGASDVEPASGVTAADATEEEEEESQRPPRTRGVLIALTLVAVVAFPFLGWVPTTLIGSMNVGASYTIIAASLVLLIGWVGQISLGHAAFVGIGAYATGYIISGLGVPFPFSLPLAAAITGIAAAGLGAVAVRVRGLYLAVATLVFAWMASEFLFRQPWVSQHASISTQTIGTEGSWPFFDLSDRRTFYLFAWAIAAIVIVVASNLRDSKTGRAFFALRGSELAAASLGIDVTRYKLIAFAASGAMAGVGGSLLMTDFRVVSVDQFTFTASLFFLAIAVVGGLRSLPGAVAAGLLFAGLSEVFFRVPALGAYLELVSAALLAFVLLAWRGGLASVPAHLAPVARRGTAAWRAVAGRVGRAWRSLEAAYRQAVARAGDAARARDARRTTARPDSSKREAAKRHAGSKQRQLDRSRGSGSKSSSRLNRILSLFGSVGRRLALRRASDVVAHEPPLDFSALMADLNTENATPELEFALPDGVAGNGHQDAGAPSRSGLEVVRARLESTGPARPRHKRRPLIEADDVTVRFGGLVAVDRSSLQVREGEIAGLIGPNGAGKTTLFNAIAGYVAPTSGAIRMYGRDVTSMDVHQRAQIGVARTFQLIQLFGDLSVHDNLLVATHVHNPSGVFAHMVVSSTSARAEQEARERVGQVIDLLELRNIARKRVASLPFGTLRMVEVARALVTGFRVIMLDEPASGLDDRETDKLIDVLRLARGLGVTLLLIEHDIRMVTSVTDHLYVLNQGKIIADGPPAQIQRDPAVIAAYLGEPAKEKEVAR